MSRSLRYDSIGDMSRSLRYDNIGHDLLARLKERREQRESPKTPTSDSGRQTLHRLRSATEPVEPDPPGINPALSYCRSRLALFTEPLAEYEKRLAHELAGEDLPDIGAKAKLIILTRRKQRKAALQGSTLAEPEEGIFEKAALKPNLSAQMARQWADQARDATARDSAFLDQLAALRRDYKVPDVDTLSAHGSGDWQISPLVSQSPSPDTLRVTRSAEPGLGIASSEKTIASSFLSGSILRRAAAWRQSEAPAAAGPPPGIAQAVEAFYHNPK